VSNENNKVIYTYDNDLQEEDNHLPNWWLFILFGSIVFAFGYWFVYHTVKSMPGPVAEYTADVDKVKADRAAILAKNPMSDESLAEYAKDPAHIEAGKQVFNTICMACHGMKAEGLVGPNLTDKFWIHGNKPSDLAKSVQTGYPEKGMPPQGDVLGPEKVRAVVSYVLTLKNTNVPGKAPQGVDESGASADQPAPVPTPAPEGQPAPAPAPAQ
jgi:cytochrome c oxidase cbb3-type subunit 3